MENRMPLRVRISRFLEERYVHRSQPHYLPELALFAIIVIVAAWPMFSLPALMENRRARLQPRSRSDEHPQGHDG